MVETRRAGVGSRLAAFWIDLIIQAVLLVSVYDVCSAFITGVYRFFALGRVGVLPFIAVFILTGIVYDAICAPAFDGGTIGKSALGLSVLCENKMGDEERPTVWRAAARSAVKHTIGLIAGIFDIISAGRALADKVADTVVIADKFVKFNDNLPAVDYEAADGSFEQFHMTGRELLLLSNYFRRREIIDKTETPLVYRALRDYFAARFEIPAEELTERTLYILYVLSERR